MMFRLSLSVVRTFWTGRSGHGTKLLWGRSRWGSGISKTKLAVTENDEENDEEQLKGNGSMQLDSNDDQDRDVADSWSNSNKYIAYDCQSKFNDGHKTS